MIDILLMPVMSDGRDLILLLWRQLRGATNGDRIATNSRQTFMSMLLTVHSLLISKMEVLTKYGRYVEEDCCWRNPVCTCHNSWLAEVDEEWHWSCLRNSRL